MRKLMSVSGTCQVSAWRGVMPTKAGEDVRLSNTQSYVRHSNQQDAGQQLGFMVVLTYS